MKTLSPLTIAVALAAGMSAATVFAAPKAVDVSHGRDGIGKNITFEGIDKVNGKGNDAANDNARVRFLASCAQSALGDCAPTIEQEIPAPPEKPIAEIKPSLPETPVVPEKPIGESSPPAQVTPVTPGTPNGPAPEITISVPPSGPTSFQNIVTRGDAQRDDVAAACVQDESFCKDANLKRVANRNSVIDEIFFYTEL